MPVVLRVRGRQANRPQRVAAVVAVHVAAPQRGPGSRTTYPPVTEQPRECEYSWAGATCAGSGRQPGSSELPSNTCRPSQQPSRGSLLARGRAPVRSRSPPSPPGRRRRSPGRRSRDRRRSARDSVGRTPRSLRGDALAGEGVVRRHEYGAAGLTRIDPEELADSELRSWPLKSGSPAPPPSPVPIQRYPSGPNCSWPPLWFPRGCGIERTIRREAGAARSALALRNSAIVIAPSGLRAVVDVEAAARGVVRREGDRQQAPLAAERHEVRMSRKGALSGTLHGRRGSGPAARRRRCADDRPSGRRRRPAR